MVQTAATKMYQIRHPHAAANAIVEQPCCDDETSVSAALLEECMRLSNTEQERSVQCTLTANFDAT